MKTRILRTSANVTTALALCVAVRGALGDAGVSYTSGVYTQDFNSLATYSSSTTLWTNNTTPPENIEPGALPVQITTAVGAPVDLTGPSADFAVSIPTISSMTGWSAVNFGGNSSALVYNVNNGVKDTPALTAYFNPNDPINLAGTSNNMALGAVTASASGNVEFGVKLVNNSTNSLNAISLSYAGQLFHQDTGAKSLNFGYAISNATSSIPTSSLTTYAAMNVGGFPTGGTGSTFATQSLSVTDLPLATAWTPGTALWLTWQINSAGGGQGLAIDDLSFSATRLAVLPTLTWNLAGSGAWDTLAGNWTGASTTFANGNNVLFGNAAANTTITVDAGGVTVSSLVTINNSANTYTFAGGPIAGSGASLVVNGGGTVRLTAANTYAFATNVINGTLIVDNNNQLGANTAALNLRGGKLKLAGSINAGTRVLSVNASGGTFDTAGFVASFGATTASLPQIQGILQVTGGGTLNLGVAPVFGNTGAPAGHLVIDAGTTVLILGNGRSSPTDMWDGGVINGTLILQTTPVGGPGNAGGRFNFESQTANVATVLTGVGVIQIPTGSKWLNIGTVAKPKGQLDGSGAIISNTSGSFAAEIDVNIQLNNLEGTDLAHPAFVRTDVTSPHAFDGTSTTGNFITVIGGTKKANNGIGPTFSLMAIGGVISGNSDISIGNDYKSGGSGNLILNAHNTYHGATMLNGGGASLPVLYLGIDNALPTDTDLVFGSINGAGAPSLDLNGHSQIIQSLCVGQVTNSPQLNQINNTGLTPATLTISGAITPFTSYNGQINDFGPTSTDPNGNINGTGGSTTAVVKMGSSTLVLGQYLDNQAGGHFTLSTYSGGTTVKGGVIQIPFDGALGAASGSLSFDGGTIAVKTPDLKYDLEQSVTWTSSRPITVTANGGTINTPTFSVTDSSSVSHNLVASVVFTGNGGYNWGGTLQLTGAAGSNMTLNGGTGTVAVSGPSTIVINPTASLTLDGSSDPVTDSADNTKHISIINDGSLQIAGSNKTLSIVSGSGTLTQAGTGITTIAGPYGANGPVNLNAGMLTFGTSAAVRQTPAVVLNFKSLTIAMGAILDIGNRDLLIGNSNLATIENQLLAGLGLGNPGDPAITSSTALSSGSTFLVPLDADTLLGDGLAGSAIGQTWANVAISQPGTIIVKYAYFGDATLDGQVDNFDFATAASNFGQSTSGISDIESAWLMGDVTLDGVVDNFDFATMASSFGSGVGNPLGTVVSPVPEPASLVLLGIGSVALLRTRRRRPHAR